ncbi:MAG TPA: DNA-binding response regulator [Clostridiales bacterium]|nr:DNA-binding response regulator [Clostridiales bacterium]
MNKLIYLADDEKNIRDLVKSYLVMEGYQVETFSDGLSVMDAYRRKKPDMMILDIMMPGMDGYAICREVRRESPIPILIVSAKDQEMDRILGLELGSDDYIAKPFSPRELVVRVKTIFRRVGELPSAAVPESEEKILCGDMTLIPGQRKAVSGTTEIDFTMKEYDFLLYMLKNRSKVYSREQLIRNIWGYTHIGEPRAIDDLVKRVRKKLSNAGSTLEIVTVWGYGYKIDGC